MAAIIHVRDEEIEAIQSIYGSEVEFTVTPNGLTCVAVVSTDGLSAQLQVLVLGFQANSPLEVYTLTLKGAAW